MLKADLLMELEEISWRQKSRCLRLQHGDKNTIFFHKMANAHKRNNHIHKLEANGTLQLINGDHLGHWKISAVEDQWLQRPLMKRILGVIKNCNGDKAPGPDGFTMDFYKKC